MKMRKSILLSTLMLLFLSSCIAMVYATNSWGSLSSGYAVTSNYHGKDVPSGATVVVTTMTTDAKVDHVIFVWKNPAGQMIWADFAKVYTNGTTYEKNGKPIYYATSTHKPEALGDWGVQAIFVDLNGLFRCHLRLFVARRATSFNVIPEVPIIGTAGASLAMLFGFTYKIKRKPKK
jgi:hypothetical protein